MKLIIKVVGGGGGGGGGGGAAFAQGYNPNAPAEMQQFLSQHPQIAAKVNSDPSLLTNSTFVQDHPELSTFMADHPDYTASLDKQADAKSMGSFMSSHPQIAEKVQQDPSLLNNQQFLDDHPELQTYMNDHPGVAAAARQNPRGFDERATGDGRNQGNFSEYHYSYGYHDANGIPGHRAESGQPNQNWDGGNNRQEAQNHYEQPQAAEGGQFNDVNKGNWNHGYSNGSHHAYGQYHHHNH